MLARERPESDRFVGLPVGSDTKLRDRNIQCFSENAERIHTGRFALIGAHTHCRVPLGVFHGLVAFANREPQVLRSHVTLQIDEGLHFVVGHTRRHFPERGHGILRHVGTDDFGDLGWLCFKPCLACCIGTGTGSFVQGF